jgi:hypothetical protein
VLTVWILGGSDLLLRTPPLSNELIRCQSDHDDYRYSHGGVTMSDGDGMNVSTRVPVTRHAWAYVVMSYLCLILFGIK